MESTAVLRHSTSGRGKHPGRRMVVSVLVGMVLAVVGACAGQDRASRSTVSSSGPATGAAPSTSAPAVAVRAALLTTTPDTRERFDFVARGDVITVSAPATNTSGNIRQVFWHDNAPESVDQQVCMDWPTPDGRAQPGIALRIRPPTADEPVRAIVLDQNLWDGVLWSIHVLLFEGTADDVSNLTSVATFPMLDTFYDTVAAPAGVAPALRPGPWHVCARVIGATVQFKAWVQDAAEPAWDDPVAARAAELPPDWVGVGRPGGYVGHVHPGRTFDFVNMASSIVRRGS